MAMNLAMVRRQEKTCSKKETLIEVAGTG